MKQFGDIKLPSNRRFGLFMATVLAIVAAYLFATENWVEAGAAGLLAAGFASTAMLRPALLTPLNRAWMALGVALGMIVSPVVLAILFFGIFTPLALLLRLFGRDELRLRRSPAGASYWRLRTPPGPQADSFRRQF